MGSSSQKQKSQQTTTTELPANQQTNVDTLLGGALDYYNSGGRNFFDGSTIAGYNPTQVEGQRQLLNFAGGAGQDLTDRAIAGNNFFLDPNNIFNPDNIPGFSGQVDALTRGYTQNLTENILPSVRGGATSSGQFGGSASGIGEALSVERSNAGLSDSLAGLYGDAYAQGLNSFNQAQNRAPALFGLGAQPGSVVAGIGDARQQQEQNEINAARERHEFEQNEALNILNVLQQLTGQAGTYGGTVESQGQSTTESGGSPITQGIGGLLSAASLFGGGGLGGAAKGGASAAGSGAPSGGGGGGLGSLGF